MNTLTEFSEGLTIELRGFRALCEEILSLVSRENQALAGAEYQSFNFFQEKKNLLCRLEKSLIALRNLRVAWLQRGQAERSKSEEVKSLVSIIPSVVMKVLLLDKQNQERLLQRGLVPANCLQSVAKPKNNYVANLYRRHSV